jgi:glycosyltransferase involved in cell wall biosynthesis
MQVSLVIITKDEHPRLRLCLSALGRQTVSWGKDAEIIIVDDGSAFPVGAGEIPPAAPPPHIIRQARSVGRSAARNAGAAVARGRRLLFLDGDVLLSPESIARHAALSDHQLGRGEQRHVSGTRFFADPRTGVPWPGQEALVARLGDLSSRLVTEESITGSPFTRLLDRSDPAIYPGAAPRRLYELEMQALRNATAPNAEWLAAAGHNFSVPRQAFEAAGGFDRAISINEHRDLALRLCRDGARIVVVEGAVSVHITHRAGWRDPLTADDGWREAFANRHPLECDLMLRFWRSLAADRSIPPEERLLSLEAVDALLRAGARPASSAS